MERLLKLTGFFLGNFGPIVVFYALNHFCGLKPALFGSILWTVGELALARLRGRSTSAFFKFSAIITIVFGLLDLHLQHAIFFRYEAAVTNALVGFYFGATLFGEKPMIQEFAEAQGRIQGELTADQVYFFKFLSVVWTGYQFIKAALYAWVAGRYTLEQGLAIRGTIGNASFYALLFISIFGAKRIKQALAKARVLPSSRPAAT